MKFIPRFRALACLLLTLFVSGVSSRAADDLSAAQAELLQRLKELVRIDTSNPPGNESRVSTYLRDVLSKEGIESEIFERDPGRGNLVARLKGSGRKRPVLLMAHCDVVGVEREKWTVDPFSAVTKDGFLYGRGASDDKSSVATFVQVFLELKRRKIPLDRDVILLVEAGEESTTYAGIDFMVNKHWDKIDCEFALNEGGQIVAGPGGKLRYVAVGTTEKVPHSMFVSATGTSGHGSMPRPDNPVVHLAAAIAKLGAWQPPAHLNATTRSYIERLATISTPEKAWILTHLEDPKIGSQVQEIVRLTDYTLNSMLRTSISPTVLKAGFRTNVIPGDALASLDVRALPDEDMTAFVQQMRRVIDDPAVDIVQSKTMSRPAAPPSSLDSEMYLALERAQKARFPGLITIPEMGTGASDSAQLRARGVQAYGVGAVSVPESNHVHGNDERVLIDGLLPFMELVWDAVVDVAGQSVSVK